ncbi:MAG: 50S ribosomal protein L11 methyltransferase, partial [Anaerolineae bacterium]
DRWESYVILCRYLQPLNPDPDALETAVTVKIYIPETEDNPYLRHRIEEVLYHMGRLYPILPPTFRQLEEEDWANAWKSHYHPFRIGHKIWIQPSWLEQETAAPGKDGVQPGDVVLTLDPGMAFGTGLHPTTQMCLLALEKLVQPGMTVLDVGTGSAILAIAAAKLGANSLLGIDTDKLAVTTATANAAQNDVAAQIDIRQGTLDTVEQRGWDMVVVNILAPVIISMLAQDHLMDYVAENGRLILSGIIEEQGEAVVTAVNAAGGYITETYQVRDWMAYVVAPGK